LLFRVEITIMTLTTPIQNQLPPGPTKPSFLQLMDWIRDPFGLLEKSAQAYGETFTLRFNNNVSSLVFLSNPELIQDVLSSDSKKFDSGRANNLLLPLVGQHSILLLDGQAHSRQRKLMFPPFHGEKIRYYGAIIHNITEKVAQQWQVGKPFPIRPSMQQITLEVIMKAVFGISDETRNAQLKHYLTQSLELAGGSVLRSSLLFFSILQQDFPGSPWRTFRRRQQFVRELLQVEIQKRRDDSNQQGNDILSLLMAARDEQGNPMSDQELQDQLLTLLFAGHETTATALSWAFYWIYKFREVRDNLLAELATINDVSDIKTLNQLSYLDAVCKETLRIYPVAFLTFPRITKSTLQIGDYEYPPDTALAPCIYLLHHREDLYPNPKQFQPERFLDHEFSPYEFMPFGGGTRRCLGDVFAPMEMKIVIATILKQYDLALAETKPVKPIRRGVTSTPAGGVKVILNDA